MVIVLNKDDGKKIIDFIHELGVLKNTKRTGWQWRGITNCESIADHSYRVIILSMLLGDLMAENGEDVDMEKLLRMATLHEICEVRIGDIPFPAVKYIGKDIKKRAESEAVRDMTSQFGRVGKRYSQLFDEFEMGQTIEAKIVKAADKLEMMVQAWEYELCGHKGLRDFFENNSTFEDIEFNEFLGKISKKLREMREKNLSENSCSW